MRRWVLIAVSTGTALWAVAQLSAGIVITNSPWPVTGFPMFKNTRSVAYHTDIFVTTKSGQMRQLQPHEFDLPRMNAAFKHLYTTPLKNHPPVATPNGKERFARIIADWNRRHSGDPAVSASLRLKVFSLDKDEKGVFGTRSKRISVYTPVRWP
jgi:hypothetical protein